MRVIGIYAVSPPVMQHLMAQRGGTDERQPQHLDSEISERRHAEARRRRTRHDAEFGKRILADPGLVEFDIALYRIEVCGRKIRNLRMKVGSQLDRLAACAAHRTCFHLVWAGHEIDTAGRREELKTCTISLIRLGFLDKAARNNAALPDWEVQCSCGNWQVFPLCMDTSRSNQAGKCPHSPLAGSSLPSVCG